MKKKEIFFDVKDFLLSFRCPSERIAKALSVKRNQKERRC